MFNPLFRLYVPGFRVRPQDDVAGFNINENHELLPGTGKLRHIDVAQAQTPPTIPSLAPSPERFAQPPPLIGFADVRVGSQDDVSGFNFNESGVPRQQTPWFDGMPPESATSEYPALVHPLPQGVLEAIQTSQPQIPDWLHKLLMMPPPRVSSAIDPRTGHHIVPYAPLIRSAETYQPTVEKKGPTEETSADEAEFSALPNLAWLNLPSTEEWPPSNRFPRPMEITALSAAAPPQQAHAQPQLPRIAGLARSRTGLATTPSVRPVAYSDFTLANAGGLAVRQQQQEVPRQDQQRHAIRWQQSPQRGIETMVPRHAYRPNPTNPLTRMEVRADPPTGFRPDTRGSVIASFGYSEPPANAAHETYRTSAKLVGPFGYTSGRFDAERGNTNSPLNLANLSDNDIEGMARHDGTVRKSS